MKFMNYLITEYEYENDVNLMRFFSFTNFSHSIIFFLDKKYRNINHSNYIYSHEYLLTSLSKNYYEIKSNDILDQDILQSKNSLDD